MELKLVINGKQKLAGNFEDPKEFNDLAKSFKSYLFEASYKKDEEQKQKPQKNSEVSKVNEKLAHKIEAGNFIYDPSQLIGEQMKTLIKQNQIQRKREKEEHNEKIEKLMEMIEERKEEIEKVEEKLQQREKSEVNVKIFNQCPFCIHPHSPMMDQKYGMKKKKERQIKKEEKKNNFENCSNNDDEKSEAETICESNANSKELKWKQYIEKKEKMEIYRNQENHYFSQNNEANKWFKELTQLSIELNPVEPTYIVNELMKLQQNDGLFATIQEASLKKLRKGQPLQGIDIQDPVHFLKLFIFMYASPGIYEKLNKLMKNYSFKFGPELTAILFRGLQKLLQDKQYKKFHNSVRKLFRGVRTEQLEEYKKRGETGFWPTFSSTSLTKMIPKMFTGQGDQKCFEVNFSHNSERNYIVFKKALVKDEFKDIFIETSSYLKEDEVLLFPGFNFFVCEKSTQNLVTVREVNNPIQKASILIDEKQLKPVEEAKLITANGPMNKCFRMEGSRIICKQQTSRFFFKKQIGKELEEIYSFSIKSNKNRIKIGIIEEKKNFANCIKYQCPFLAECFQQKPNCVQMRVDLHEERIRWITEKKQYSISIKPEDKFKTFFPTVFLKNEDDEIIMSELIQQKD